MLLEQTLQQISNQQTSFPYEIVIVDNDSTDHSLQVAQKFNCKIVHLPKGEFTYGKAINVGIANSEGEYIMIISSHVLLLQNDFLEKIPFYFSDNKIAGLRFINTSAPQQLVESVKKGVQKIEAIDDMNFANKYWNNLIVNHCSAIRKSCWEIETFNELLNAGEDKLWALNILKQGYHLLYNVPVYYAYVAEISMNRKISKRVREEYSKKMIIGNAVSEYEKYFMLYLMYKMKRNSKTFFKGLLTDIKIYFGYKREKKRFKNLAIVSD